MPDLESLPLINRIPDTAAVRFRLSQLVREYQLLTGLLRLSKQKREAAERDRFQRKEGGQDAS